MAIGVPVVSRPSLLYSDSDDRRRGLRCRVIEVVEVITKRNLKN